MKKKWRKNLGLMASVFLFSSFSYGAIDDIEMAVGYYWPNKDAILPLLASSKDRGATWSYAPDISSRSILPSDFTDEDYPMSSSHNSLVSISCQKDFCMTVGRYKNREGRYVPLIGLSQNHGASWTYTSLKPTDYVDTTGYFVDPIKTACNTKMCLTAMPYMNTQNEWSYFAVTTEDQGHSWSYSKFIPGLPKGRAVVISGLECSDQACIGVGYVTLDRDKSPKKGFIILSKDQGKTWTFPKVDMPAKLQGFTLEDVKCKGNICLAKGVGFGSDPHVPYLVLLRSENGGNSWEEVLNDYHVLYNDQAGHGAISYTDDTWAIAASAYSKGIDHYEWHPLVLVSYDEGKTWQQPADIISKLPDELARTHHIEGQLINCFGTSCILTTITWLENKDMWIPAIAMSQDKGLTWSYVDISPADLGGLTSIDQLFGDEKNLLIMGSYTTKQKKSKPFLLLSKDKGKTWYSPVLNLPEYVAAGFYGNSNTPAYRAKQFGIQNKLEQVLKQEKK